MSAKIVLFDLGNVVVDWRPILLYRNMFETEAEAEWFCTHVCNMAWHVNHDRGVSMDDNAPALIAEYPQFEAQIRAWKTRWMEMFAGYVEGTPQIMSRLEEAQVPLYGLTNLPAEVAQSTFDRFPMIKILRDIIISGVEKVVKPDPRIYEIVLERLGQPDPADIFFIDDSLKNIETATAMGFRGHHFQGAKGLEAALIGEGLL